MVSNQEIVARLFLQLTLIIVCCNLAGWIGRKFLKQSTVFMEMVVGVILGPSLLGVVNPELEFFIFPKHLSNLGIDIKAQHPNMAILYGLAQIGLVLYMFVVGSEISIPSLRKKFKASLTISTFGILAPFLFALPTSYFLFHSGGFFSDKITLTGSYVALACAFSVTAFPMLARMLSESALSSTRLGTIVLSAAAIDDFVAWIIFPIAITTTAVATQSAGFSILLAISFLSLLAFLFRHFSVQIDNIVQAGFTPLIIIILFLSCSITDLLGISAVFGAFACGAFFPRTKCLEESTERFKSVSTAIFLPCFFVYTGLNTKITLVNTPALVLTAVGICLIAFLSKGIPCFLAARVNGETLNDSIIVGSLMNARGLMELILLNVFLDKSIITPTFFSIMVVMTIATTSIASPVYNSLLPKSRSVILPSS